MNSRCRSVFQRASALMAERQGFQKALRHNILHTNILARNR